jgi:hypothetical protein
MAMFSSPFWLFGFYILSTPLRARQKAVRTIYAVTDRRALTLVLDGSVQVRSFFLDRMEGFEKDERPDGSGDLILRHDIIEDSEGKDRRAAGFFGIHDVREPEAILRKLRSRGSDVG